MDWNVYVGPDLRTASHVAANARHLSFPCEQGLAMQGGHPSTPQSGLFYTSKAAMSLLAQPLGLRPLPAARLRAVRPFQAPAARPGLLSGRALVQPAAIPAASLGAVAGEEAFHCQAYNGCCQCPMPA